MNIIRYYIDRRVIQLTKERRISVQKILAVSLMTTLSIPMSTVTMVIRTIEKMLM
jgi:hypothetical protein